MKPDKQTISNAPVTEITLSQTINICGHQTPIEDIVKAWMNLSVALNSLNRSMGLPEPYPVVLFPGIQDKIKLIHQVIHDLPVDKINPDNDK